MKAKIAAMGVLRDWFQKNKRSFPWRNNQVDHASFPYRIWISEVMLQQTRAEVVVPFFLTWMKQFPTMELLARAEEREVMKAWEGLGYYARAKRLWLGAKYLIENHRGKLPSHYEELLKIPGFGPYTAGAVASFAFQRKAAAVDGNVARVIARLFAIEEEIDQVKVQKQLRELTFALLPDKEPWIIMEGLIELGALVCRKIPQCSKCPLQGVCDAQRCKIAQILPLKKRKEKIERIEREVTILLFQTEVLISLVPQGKVMAGLYEFPYFPKDSEPLQVKLKEWLMEEPELLSCLDIIEHSFTRFRVRLHPSILQCKHKRVLDGYEWYPLEKLKELPFSAGHRKLLKELLAIKDQYCF